MTDGVTSESERLDEVLGGGLPADAINLIIGPPGSGKTVLAQRCMFQNATDDRPGVYLSTVSEPLEKILRYGQALAFFDPSAIGRRSSTKTSGESCRLPRRPQRRARRPGVVQCEPVVGVRGVPPCRQRRGAAIPALRLADRSDARRTEDPREQARSHGPKFDITPDGIHVVEGDA